MQFEFDNDSLLKIDINGCYKRAYDLANAAQTQGQTQNQTQASTQSNDNKEAYHFWTNSKLTNIPSSQRKTIMPYIRSGAKAVGKEAARAGGQILNDLSRGDMPLHESVRARSKESGRKLAKKAGEKLSNIMKGRGYKARRKTAAVSRRRNVLRCGG
ncbi:unnamed protein product [Trichogramma brassicae]|uniref:Uncharacterized protein n=1 Tax=Trichogramma brassicae TaxID=86971 RepID=A0A6H5IRQ7_9HYME|nr:unnamed protein product [Trichogramma brassicae]